MSEIECNNNHDRKPAEVPRVGLVFNSEDDLREFYRNYAFHMGFGVSKISNRKRNDLQYYTLACSRYGHYVSTSSNPRPTTACNCLARVNVKVSREGQYEISKVVLDHNHDLSPNNSRRYRSHKNRNLCSTTLKIDDAVRLRINKSFNNIVHETCDQDNLPLNEAETRTYIRKARLELEVGDLEALKQYFSRMTVKNGEFYYNMDLDKEGQLRNVFWADARCRATYESFSDVITFNNTYLRNKYDVPLTSFFGVNHHGQSIMFGCALLSSETTSTYIWLFRTWLECMGGLTPRGIVTDQCATMKEAIATVFPHTKHRFCVWHIMHKIPAMLGAHDEYKMIKKTLKYLVYESIREIEFELGWQEMLEKFGLQTNDWLLSLYDTRTTWVPLYLKKHFWAGMSTTQWSESINAFFDGCLNSKTSLKQFLVAYDSALRKKVEKENQSDFTTFHKNLPLVTLFVVEKQFANVYTHDILRMFQAELKELCYCNVREVNSGTYEVTYTSRGKDGQRKQRMFLVDVTDRIMECECSFFNFQGIICRHIVATMNYCGVDEIYDQYILARWRKDIRRRHTLIASSYDDDSQTPQMRKYDDLVRLARPGHELVVTTLDSKAYEWWKEYITSGVKKLLSWVSEPNSNATCDVGASNLNTCRQRLRSPTKILKSMVEKPPRKKGKMTISESSNVLEETSISILPTQTSLSTFLSQTSMEESIENNPQPLRMILPTYDVPTP